MLYMHDFMTFMCVWHMKRGNFAIWPGAVRRAWAFLQTPCPDPVIVQVSGSVGCTEGERAIDWTLVQGVFEVLQPKKNHYSKCTSERNGFISGATTTT